VRYRTEAFVSNGRTTSTASYGFPGQVTIHHRTATCNLWLLNSRL
jgi:hypothetical protein